MAVIFCLLKFYGLAIVTDVCKQGCMNESDIYSFNAQYSNFQEGTFV